MLKLITIILGLSISATFAAGKHATEISQAQRKLVATKQLQLNSQTLALYVKGLICESCGIGVKKKAARLKFLDKSQFTKGYKIDAKNQLLYLAIRADKKADYQAINKAVTAAGYVPSTYYVVQNKKIKSFSAASK